MATRLVDVPQWPNSDARAIGRARDLGVPEPKQLQERGATLAAHTPPVARPASPVFTLAEVEKLVTERLTQAVEKATEKAYQQGYTDGSKAVESAKAKWLNRLQEGIDQSLERLYQKLAQVEQLSFEAARVTLERILGYEGARTRLLVQIVQHQMALLADTTVLRIRLSQRDTQKHPDLIGTLQAGYGGRVQILEDAQLGQGKCVFDLEMGQIDAGIDTQLEMIRTHFAKARETHADA